MRRELGILRQLVPAACMLGIMFVASAAVIVQHRLFDTPFLLSRTALFFLPLFALFATFLFDVIAGLGAPIKALAVLVSGAAAVLMAGHFAATANVSYTWDWKRDAGTKAMVDDLAARRLIRPLSVVLRHADGPEHVLDGLYTVAPEALRALDDAAVVALHRADRLAPAAVMAASLAQVERLRQLHDATQPRAIASIAITVEE